MQLTLKQYLAQMLMCEPALNMLGRLGNEYICDAYLRLQEDRLNFLKLPQLKQRRVANRSAVNAAGESGEAAGRVILPADYGDGPRAAIQMVEDAMLLTRKYGKPHFFITGESTTNMPT